MTEQRYTHAETLERLKADPMSQSEAIRATMVEFDARIEELQKYCKEAIGSQTAARFKTESVYEVRVSEPKPEEQKGIFNSLRSTQRNAQRKAEGSGQRQGNEYQVCNA
jgi:hypothetical protein